MSSHKPAQNMDVRIRVFGFPFRLSRDDIVRIKHGIMYGNSWGSSEFKGKGGQPFPLLEVREIKGDGSDGNLVLAEDF